MSTYNKVSPPHYQNFSVEVIEMMERIWGPEKVAIYCELNAFKYKMRMGDKPEESLEVESSKAKYYIDKANELNLRVGCKGKSRPTGPPEGINVSEAGKKCREKTQELQEAWDECKVQGPPAFVFFPEGHKYNCTCLDCIKTKKATSSEEGEQNGQPSE